MYNPIQMYINCILIDIFLCEKYGDENQKMTYEGLGSGKRYNSVRRGIQLIILVSPPVFTMRFTLESRGYQCIPAVTQHAEGGILVTRDGKVAMVVTIRTF